MPWCARGCDGSSRAGVRRRTFVRRQFEDARKERHVTERRLPALRGRARAAGLPGEGAERAGAGRSEKDSGSVARALLDAFGWRGSR